MNIVGETKLACGADGSNISDLRCGKNVDIVGVTGSIPVTPTIFSRTYAGFAKWPAGSMNLIRLFFVFRSPPVPVRRMT